MASAGCVNVHRSSELHMKSRTLSIRLAHCRSLAARTCLTCGRAGPKGGPESRYRAPKSRRETRNSDGFVRHSCPPAASARSRHSRSRTYADTTIIRGRSCVNSSHSRRVAVMPSVTGICKSSSIASGRRACNIYRLGPVAGHVDGVARRFEQDPRGVPSMRFVVHDENVHLQGRCGRASFAAAGAAD